MAVPAHRSQLAFLALCCNNPASNIAGLFFVEVSIMEKRKKESTRGILTKKDVLGILYLLRNTPMTLKQIGDKYGVSKNQISLIKQNKSWTNIEREPIVLGEIVLPEGDIFYKGEGGTKLKLHKIPGHERYAADRNGDVYALIGNGRVLKNPKRLKQAVDSNGRHIVSLSGEESGTQYTHRVSQLVCAAFHGPRPTEKHMALHEDDNKDNNKKTNLYWGLHKRNMEDRARNGTTYEGSKNPFSKFSEEQVSEVIELLRSGEFTQREIALHYDVTFQAIQLIKLNKSWTHVDRKGYVYIPKPDGKRASKVTLSHI